MNEKTKDFDEVIKMLHEQKELTERITALAHNIALTVDKYDRKSVPEMLQTIPNYNNQEITLEEAVKQFRGNEDDILMITTMEEPDLEEFFERILFQGGGFFGYVQNDSTYSIAFFEDTRFSGAYYKTK